MRNIAIKKFNPSDCQKLFKLISPDIFKWLPYGTFNSESAFANFYTALSKKCELYTVYDKYTDNFFGIFALKNISRENLKCEIGHIWYAKQYQRTNINTEAMYLILEECFDRRSYRRVSWKCDALNTRSQESAERMGFRYEGLFKNDQIVKNKNKDTIWYAIIDKEWHIVKNNFDLVINQKTDIPLSTLNLMK